MAPLTLLLSPVLSVVKNEYLQIVALVKQATAPCMKIFIYHIGQAFNLNIAACQESFSGKN
jgi:hypothetical protein